MSTGFYRNFQFDYESARENSYARIFFKWTDNSKIPNVIIFTGAIYETLTGVWDIYAEFFFISAIFPLWLLASEFQQVIQQEVKVAKLRCKYHGEFNLHSVELYKEIQKLSRSFSKGYGYPLMSYLIYYLLYHSIGVDRLFVSLTFGVKLYDSVFMMTFLMVYGFAAHYAFKVRSKLFS